MKLKTVFAALLSSAVLFTGSSYVFAGEVDALLEKLVEKKILTESEAKDIGKEIKKESEESKKSSSSWADKVKVKGDVRLRYQTEDKDNDGNPSRDRYRVRARLGVVANPDDKWEAGIGAASGGDDPRSTNETLDKTFESPDLRLDYAYAKYSPSKMISITGGKIKNPIWGTKDLLWDSDINPEGFAATVTHKFADNFEMFFTPAYFILDEYKTESDPSMLAIQPGINWKLNDNTRFQFAMTYYKFSNVQGNDFSLHGSGTNSVDESGNLIYDYDSIALDADFGIKLPDRFGFVEYANIFGQYVDSDADNDNKGYLYGLKFGNKSLRTIKSWEVKVNYRELEKDAWLDFLPDSDFYGGATGVKGMEYELKIGLTKHLSFALDYYHAKPIDNSEKQNILQADLVYKF